MPAVRVPVLSNNMTRILVISSSAEARLNRIPARNPSPLPTISAVGVANPIAHGHAITSTAVIAVNAITRFPANHIHAKKVMTAIAITAGTKRAATASATRWMGALSPCASATILTICASAVSEPTRVARTVIAAAVLSVPPETSAPAALSIGIDSPVSIDSSIALAPVTITPSTGILEAGLTITTSPTANSDAGTTNSLPSRTTVAVSGTRVSKDRNAAIARPRARASSNLPKRIKRISSSAVSKNRGPAKNKSGKVVRIEYRYAALIPSATRVSMLAVRLRAAIHAPR